MIQLTFTLRTYYCIVGRSVELKLIVLFNTSILDTQLIEGLATRWTIAHMLNQLGACVKLLETEKAKSGPDLKAAVDFNPTCSVFVSPQFFFGSRHFTAYITLVR